MTLRILSHLSIRRTWPCICCLFCCVLLTSAVLAQTGAETIGSTPKGAVSDTAQNRKTLDELAKSGALTVRALIAFDRMPSSLMAPLAGLRGRGIDVLGASPEKLAQLLEDQNVSLDPKEREALTRILATMREAGQPAPAENAEAEVKKEMEALDRELDQITADNLGDVLSKEEMKQVLGANTDGQGATGIKSASVSGNAAQEAASEPTQNADQPSAVPDTAGSAADDETITAVTTPATPTRQSPPARPQPSAAATLNPDAESIPSAPPTPFLDMNTLSKTQWDGAVTAAMEGMRMVYGPMTAGEEEAFGTTWGVLRQHPTPEAVEYMNAFNPLLGEFLSLRGAVADTGLLLEEAAQHVAWASEAADLLQTMESLTVARQYKNTLLSYQKRLDEVIAELVALGNPPDGAELMAEGQQQYRRAKEFLSSLVSEQGPEGEWIGYVIHPKGYLFVSKQGLKHQPHHFFIYAHGDPRRYYGIALDTGTYEEKEYKYVEQVELEDMGILDSFHGDRLEFRYTDEEGDTWIVFAERYTGGPLPIYPEAAPEQFEKARAASLKEKEERMLAAESIADPEKRSAEMIGAELGHSLTTSTIKEALEHYRMRSAFHAAAEKWAGMSSEMADSEEERLRAFDSLVAGAAPQEVVEKPQVKPKKTQEKAVATRNEQGETPLHMVDDKNAEERLAVDQEAIDFHSANMGIIKLNMDKDKAELDKETDPVRRNDLEMRLLNAHANLQSEQDRIDSLKTGFIVHTRSAWDDFAKSQFIQNIAEDQRNMEKVSRAMHKALSMADTLPVEQAMQVREIVSKGFNPQVMAATDTAKASKVIAEVYTVATSHWEVEKNKADADAEWADTCLQTATVAKSAADKSLMLLSFAGGSAVNRVYQGMTGYIEGGPKEAFLRVGGSYNQLTGIAVDGYRGFEAAVEQGGGWEEGFKGAGWEIVQGMVMDKAMQIGASGVSKGYGALKSRGTGADASPAPKVTTDAKTPAPAVSLARKPAGVQDDGFNRPLTEADRQAHREQVADARNRVNSYKKTFEKLDKARQDKAPAEDIKKILHELDDRSAKIHASPQAKMMMKTHQRDPKNKEMIKRYVNSVDRVHTQVEKRFHEKMDAEWSNEKLAPIRNADSGKSVNMDFDIAREVQLDASGRPVPPMKNGKPVADSVWQTEAQKRWEESYREVTGQDPQRSWETVTTGAHPEAYRDLAVIEKNGILNANKRWAEQTADVNQFKGDHLRGNPNFSRIEKHIEIARSTSKECDKRLFPLMDSKAPAKTDTANYNAWLKHRQYWEKMNSVLSDMGTGRLDPLEGDRRIRLLSGGKSSLEVTHDLRNFMEALLKFGKS